MAPEKMIAEYPDLPIIVTPAYQRVKDEIRDFLKQSGVSDERIFYLISMPEKQYFGPEFIVPLPNEVYIDGGCYDAETIMDFMEFAGTGKIYGFEPEPDCYNRSIENLRRNHIDFVKMFRKGLWDSVEIKKFTATGVKAAGSRISETGLSEIETVSIDETIDPLDKVTFIKMDIEGSELMALKGAEKTIRNCLPRLAICVYHKPEDIVEIPDYILSLSPNYKFYLRHHAPWVFHETVLYALP